MGSRMSPFGEHWYASSPSRRRFTSYERDMESGLDYAMFRYDAQTLGRFTSADPMGGSFVDPQSLNGYSYGENDPINHVDSLGLFIQLPELYLNRGGGRGWDMVCRLECDRDKWRCEQLCYNIQDRLQDRPDPPLVVPNGANGGPAVGYGPFKVPKQYLDCLSKLVGQDAGGVEVMEYSSTAQKMGVLAFTAPNSIFIAGSGAAFFQPYRSAVILEEYFHVLRQWKTGSLNVREYVTDSVFRFLIGQHTHDDNRFEREAMESARFLVGN